MGGPLPLPCFYMWGPVIPPAFGPGVSASFDSQSLDRLETIFGDVLKLCCYMCVSLGKCRWCIRFRGAQYGGIFCLIVSDFRTIIIGSCSMLWQICVDWWCGILYALWASLYSVILVVIWKHDPLQYHTLPRFLWADHHPSGNSEHLLWLPLLSRAWYLPYRFLISYSP